MSLKELRGAPKRMTSYFVQVEFLARNQLPWLGFLCFFFSLLMSIIYSAVEFYLSRLTLNFIPIKGNKAFFLIRFR